MRRDTPRQGAVDKKEDAKMSAYESKIPGKHMYEPRTVLMLMKEQDSMLANAVALYLAAQGMTVQMTSHQPEGTPITDVNYFDVFIAGKGFDNLVKQAELIKDRGSVFTVAVSTNGVNPDRKLSDGTELAEYVRSGALVNDYISNRTVQSARHAEEYGPTAELEIQLMEAN
jgi:hypothetical protein